MTPGAGAAGQAARVEPREAPAGATIPLSVPEIAGNEWRYIKDCLDSGWVSSVGAFVERFEAEFAARLGAAHAVATINGTAALHVALRTVGLRPEDEVVMPSFTFIAPANAVRYAGAWPVFVDAEPETWQMDPARVVHFLERQCLWTGSGLCNRATGRRIGALLPVHVLGHPVDLAPILAVAERYGLPVVEDVAESLGARYHGQPVGRLGQIACFSFNGNKVMTTGGGGMLVTDDPTLAEQARYLTTTARDDALEGVHGTVGYNYRLTNIQAAMGCAQLERLDALLAAKRRIAARYREALAGLSGVQAMPEADWAESAFWLYSIRLDEEAAGLGSRELRARLARAGIETRTFWQPLHLSPAHSSAPCLGGAVAERLHREILSLPCSCGLTPADQDRVIAALREALGA
ncbi:MAG: LegC family aminotransferase [Rhodospirillales bacterium]|nr:LegC family aminotransferase [Rhodospirillales bacterium]